MQGVDLAVAHLTACIPRLALALSPPHPLRCRAGGQARRDGLGRRGRRCLGAPRCIRHLDRAKRRLLARQQAFQHIAEIGEQVPAVGDLHGPGGTLPRPLGVGPAAVAADDLDTGARFEPGGEASGTRIREEIDRASALEIDQDRGIRDVKKNKPSGCYAPA